MKAVVMMKKAINDSNLNGYRWTADKNGLHWEYCNTNFDLTIEKDEIGSDIVKFEDKQTGESVCTFPVNEEDAWLCDGPYADHDFLRTFDEAIYWAARKMIAKANYCY